MMVLSSNPIRRRQRGSALVLAIFILFAMLSLGMLAMRTATQSIRGTSNARLTKQARYVAEIGLYHAITMMNREGSRLLPSRDTANMVGSRIILKSPRSSPPEARADVTFRTQAGEEVVVAPRSRVAPAVWNGPNPLGIFGETSGFVPSYAVEVTGFKPWSCPAGFDEAALAETGQGCCLMHFESKGVIARTEHPSADEYASEDGINRFAEHVLRAGVVIGPFSLQGCAP